MSSLWLEAQLISQLSYQFTALYRVISLLAACLEKAFHWGRGRANFSSLFIPILPLFGVNSLLDWGFNRDVDLLKPK